MTHSSQAGLASIRGGIASNVPTLYSEVAGTICYIHGERGTVRQIKYGRQGQREGAFVSLDERPAMLYLTLGRTSGGRHQHSEIVDAREIDRDTFDEITGLAQVRRDMGWSL